MTWYSTNIRPEQEERWARGEPRRKILALLIDDFAVIGDYDPEDGEISFWQCGMHRSAPLSEFDLWCITPHIPRQ
jgi:hypothetical protein